MQIPIQCINDQMLSISIQLRPGSSLRTEGHAFSTSFFFALLVGLVPIPINHYCWFSSIQSLLRLEDTLLHIRPTSSSVPPSASPPRRRIGTSTIAKRQVVQCTLVPSVEPVGVLLTGRILSLLQPLLRKPRRHDRGIVRCVILSLFVVLERLSVLLVLTSVVTVAILLRPPAPSTRVLDVARHRIEKRALLIVRRLLLLFRPGLFLLFNGLGITVGLFPRSQVGKARVHPGEIEFPGKVLLLGGSTERTRGTATSPAARRAIASSPRREPSGTRCKLFEWDHVGGRADGLS